MTSENTPPPTVGQLLGEFLERLGQRRNITPAVSDEPDFIDGAALADWNRERALAWHASHTPQHYRAAVADLPEVAAWVRALAGGHHPGSLLLQGLVGSGKTYQAYGALRLLAESGATPLPWQATTAAELYRRLRPGGDTDPAALMHTLCTAPLLLLDDLGAARKTDFTEEVTLSIVDARYTAELLTIITTNLNADQMPEIIGYRTASRLVEMCAWITMPDADRRWTR